jgi:hypothetical protein
MTTEASERPAVAEDFCDECGVRESELPNDEADFLCGCATCDRTICEGCVYYGLCTECSMDRMLEENASEGPATAPANERDDVAATEEQEK